MLDVVFWTTVIAVMAVACGVIGLRSFDVRWSRIAIFVTCACLTLGVTVTCVLWSFSTII